MDTDGIDEPSARQRIFEAAITEFASFGFAGARINRIAERAHANKQLIYRYFGNKQDLYATVMKEMVIRTQRERDARPGVAGIHRLASFASAWARMLAWEGLDLSNEPAAREERQQSVTRQIEVVVALQRSGAIASDLDPRFVLATTYAVQTMPAILPQLTEFCFGEELVSSGQLPELWGEFLERLITDDMSPAQRAES
ncbi:MAG: helix-turn-helix domain-containing protein [Mycetocola sp.]